MKTAFLLLFLSFGLSACADAVIVDRAHETGLPLDPRDEVSFQIHPSWRNSPPDCIAVLPFTAGPGIDAEGVRVVRRAIFAHLAPQGRREIKLERVDRLLAELPADDDVRRRRLGEQLRCRALLTGTVTAYSAEFWGVASRVSVGADLRLVDAADGTLLWQGRHTAHTFGGSIPLSPVGLAMGVLDAAHNVRDEQLLRVTDDLARRLAATVPDDVPAAYDDPVPGPARIVCRRPSAEFLAGLEGKPDGERRAALLDAVESRRFPGEDGRAVADALLALAPDDAEARVAVGDWLLAEGDHAGALGAARRAVALDSKLAPGWFLEGRVLMADGAYADAEPAVLKAVALERGNAIYLNALGWLNGQRGASDRALAAYRMAIDADPADGFAWYNTAVIRFDAGDLTEAGDAFYGAGLAYLKRGDYGRAEKALADLKDLSRRGLPLAKEIATIDGALAALTRRST